MLNVDIDRLLPKARQKAAPSNYELWPEHVRAWDVYLGCSTQWVKTSVGLGGVIWEGLNYPGVEVVMRRYRVPADQEEEVFLQLQVLESETVRIRNKAR